MRSAAPYLGVVIAACLSSCIGPEEPEPSAPHQARRPVAPLPASPPAAPSVSLAPRCSDSGAGFEEWLPAFGERAIAQGISRDVATRALADVVYDPAILELDRTQKPHKVPFASFAASHVTSARVRRGRRLLVMHAELLAKIEARFGVPPEILVALWGLETDFGAYQGETRTLDALATLAYDCRRAERFRGELTSALRILQRGDLAAGEMVGAWAGELGQTQFLPSSYERFGVDFDGDGRVDLIDSTEDALGLDRELPRRQRLAPARGLWPRVAEPHGAGGVEQVGGVPEGGGTLRVEAGSGEVSTYVRNT